MDELKDRIAVSERELASLKQTIYGITGSNGIYGDLRAFRREFHEYVAKESVRREEDAKAKSSATRAVNIALLAAVIALIGTISTLITVATL